MTYADAFHQTFAHESDFLNFLKDIQSRSHWDRHPAHDLEIIALDEGDPLTQALHRQYEHLGTEGILDDTMEHTRLLLKAQDELTPVRSCAIKTILDRARISGSALSQLSKPHLAEVLNRCLNIARGNALLWYSDGKISAVHGGDANDYAVLEIPELFQHAVQYLSDHFPGYTFAGGSFDHSMVTAIWELTDQDDLIETYRTALARHGLLDDETSIRPAVQLSTSNTGISGANLYPMLLEGAGSKIVPLGSPIRENHKNGADLTQFDENLVKLFAQYQSNLDTLTELLDIELAYPYFKEKGITLAELEAKDLKEFYRSERIGDPEHGIAGKKGTTVARYHANIHAALECAVEDNLIGHNAAHHQRPTTEKFIGSFYTPEEALECMRLAEGTKLELAVCFGLFYGLRRSEIVGLQWHNFDFEHNTFTIAHTVTTYRRKGKGKVSRYAKDKTKNKSSLRTLPLIPLFREKLLALKEKQEYERELFKGSYVKDYIGYVYVNEIGELIHPDYISTEFPKFLRKHGLRKIRFHDTRHSCASLLLRNGVSMKQIQAWLGHSDYGTTANLYAHLDLEDSMLLSASMLTTGLFGASTDHAPSTDSELTDPRHGTAP